MSQEWQASRQISNFGPFLQYLPNSYIKSEARTEFSGLFYIYSKFPAFKLVSFMAYTCNIQVGETGLDVGPRDGPHQPGPMTATPWQPHSLMSTLTLSTFNLININYDNLWLHILNVVEGLMWIGKNSLNNFISHLSWFKKLSPTHTHPIISICEFLNPIIYYFWVRVTHKMLNVNCIKIYSIILSVTCHGLRNFPLLIHIPSYPFINFEPYKLLFFELESLVKCWRWIGKKFTQ